MSAGYDPLIHADHTGRPRRSEGGAVVSAGADVDPVLEDAKAELEPYGHRLIRTFLRDPDADAERHFWSLIYSAFPDVSLATAQAVDGELVQCGRKVRDVVDGWRPRALVDHGTSLETERAS